MFTQASSYLFNLGVSLIPDISDITVSSFFPTPENTMTTVENTGEAALVGEIYGLVGKYLYPNDGIIPHHYAIWFAIAFQLQSVVARIERILVNFLFEQTIACNDDSVLHGTYNYFKQKCQSGAALVRSGLNRVDCTVSAIFDIHVYSEITDENVNEATYIEMCRYRLWSVFWSTVVIATSFALAHRVTTLAGLKLAAPYSFPVYLLIESIAIQIFVVPALHQLVHSQNERVNGLEEGRMNNTIKWTHRTVKKSITCSLK